MEVYILFIRILSLSVKVSFFYCEIGTFSHSLYLLSSDDQILPWVIKSLIPGPEASVEVQEFPKPMAHILEKLEFSLGSIAFIMSNEIPRVPESTVLLQSLKAVDLPSSCRLYTGPNFIYFKGFFFLTFLPLLFFLCHMLRYFSHMYICIPYTCSPQRGELRVRYHIT